LAIALFEVFAPKHYNIAVVARQKLLQAHIRGELVAFVVHSGIPKVELWIRGV
jgi:hypothetical protein